MRRRAPRTSECARALWLLGLQPPVDPDFAIGSSLAGLDVIHHGLSSWKPVVQLLVWLSLATGVYTLERAARKDV